MKVSWTHLVLVEYYGTFGVDANGKQRCKHFTARDNEVLGVLWQSKRVPSYYGEQQLVFGRCFALKLDPILQGSKEVT